MSTLAPPLSPSEHDCLCRWAARIGLNRIATTIGTSRSALQRIAGEGRASPAMRARLSELVAGGWLAKGDDGRWEVVG